MKIDENKFKESFGKNLIILQAVTHGLTFMDLALLLGTIFKEQDESYEKYNFFKEYLDKFMKFDPPLDELDE